MLSFACSLTCEKLVSRIVFVQGWQFRKVIMVFDVGSVVRSVSGDVFELCELGIYCCTFAFALA